MNELAQLLKDARIRKGLTIRALAPMVHAGESQISTWERGVHRPSPRFIANYIDAGLLSKSQIAKAYFTAIGDSA